MSEHISEITLNALIDDELSPAEVSRVEAHLAECAACSTKALSGMMLKSRAAQAGQRYALPQGMRDRVPVRHSPTTSPVRMSWVVATAAVAAALLVTVAMGFVERRSMENAAQAALITELTDQHVSGMAAGQQPEVLSSDRHTVKPWFQGKIPFSFNLPDGLPGDTTLDGANLVYAGHRPMAQLLYTVGKHRVSVFMQEGKSPERDATVERSGFHVIESHAAALEIVAVSDVEPARLNGLVAAIRDAQTR